jgi:hypothetical protein
MKTRLTKTLLSGTALTLMGYASWISVAPNQAIAADCNCTASSQCSGSQLCAVDCNQTGDGNTGRCTAP